MVGPSNLTADTNGADEVCEPAPTPVFNDVMLDIETLSLHPHNALILSIGIIEFDPSSLGKPLFGKRTLIIPSRDEQLILGRDVSSGTQQFWRDQPAEARAHWVRGTQVSLETAAGMLYQATFGKSGVWSHGIAFDISNIEGLLLQLGQTKPWHYQAPTDCRTFLKRTPQQRTIEGEPQDYVDFPLIKHEPLSDCVYQACGVWEHTSQHVPV